MKISPKINPWKGDGESKAKGSIIQNVHDGLNQLLFYRTVRDHRHKAAIYLYSIPFTTFPLFPICTEMWVIKFEFDTPHIVN